MNFRHEACNTQSHVGIGHFWMSSKGFPVSQHMGYLLARPRIYTYLFTYSSYARGFSNAQGRRCIHFISLASTSFGRRLPFKPWMNEVFVKSIHKLLGLVLFVSLQGPDTCIVASYRCYPLRVRYVITCLYLILLIKGTFNFHLDVEPAI